MKNQWILILGGSSGLGLATAKKMAHHGYHIAIVHRDRRVDLEAINSHFKEITSKGVKLVNYNIDATNPSKRKDTVDRLKSTLSNSGKIKMLVHSIAKGSLKPMVSEKENTLNQNDIKITLNAMALSLYDWTKELFEADLFVNDSRIVAFTSEGSNKAWKGYAAVSAAKATLEALIRSIALEYASKGLKANCIQAGTTETKAFTMIPNSAVLKQRALERNPNNRLTIPEDVANAVYVLSMEEAKWITGTIVKVDGGESLR